MKLAYRYNTARSHTSSTMPKWLLLSLAYLSLYPHTLLAAALGEFPCTIEPAQMIEIRSPVVGLLESVPVRRGALVKRGQVLAVLESSVENSAAETARFRAQAQGALLSAKSKLTGATAKAQRFQQLYEEEFVSAQARDDAENERKMAAAELQVAQDNAMQAKLEYHQTVNQLRRRILRSPVDGVIADQYLFPGALVDTAESKKPILKVAQTNVLTVTAMLPLRFFEQVRVGDEVIVMPEKPFTRSIKAQVKAVDRLIDSTSGTYGVIAELTNTTQSLPGGIRCTLQAFGH